MKFNFRKIASVFASVVMIGSTVGIAAAATSYPTPFSNGDVAIVYTSLNPTSVGSASDLAAATSIQADLAKSVTTGSVTLEGEKYKIERSSDKFNLGDSASTIRSTITDDELPTLLADGTYFDDNNNDFDYTQKIDLGNNVNLTLFSDSDYKDKVPTLGFDLGSGNHILNYTLDFSTDPDFTSAALTTTDLKLLGKTYYVSGVNAAGTALTLLDSGNTGIVTEGESITVEAGGKSYVVEVAFVSETSTKLTVNGETTNSLAEGGTFKLKDGSYVGVKDILYTAKTTGISKVEFTIGSGKLVLTDTQNVDLNGDSLNDVTAYVTNTTGKLDKIVLSWNLDEQHFITSDKTLELPGFKAISLAMTGMNFAKQETIEVTYDGDKSIDLKAPIKDGLASFNILHQNATNGFDLIGKDSTTNLITSGNNVLTFNNTDNIDEYFVASWNSGKDSESYLLSTTVTSDSAANYTTVKNEVTGNTICNDKKLNEKCNIGNIELTFSAVYKSGNNKWTTMSINSGGSFNTLYTAEGMKIYLPYNNVTGSPRASINLTNANTTYTLQFEQEDKDGSYGATGSKNFNLTLGATASDSTAKTQVSGVVGGFPTSGFEKGETDVYDYFIVSDLASEVLIDTSGTQDTAKVIYHGEQAYADVFITSAAVSSSGGVQVFKDTESASFGSKNIIVVGGSCVNAVAAKMLGSDTPLCGDDFKAKTGVDGISTKFIIETLASPYTTGKIAVLVAGWEATDTKDAATKLLEKKDDLTVGKSQVYPIVSA